jgi:hypothetical protein
MVPLLKFFFHEEVRSAAAQSLPELLRAAALASKMPGGPDAAFVRSMLEYMWQPLLDAIEKVRRSLLSSWRQERHVDGCRGCWVPKPRVLPHSARAERALPASRAHDVLRAALCARAGNRECVGTPCAVHGVLHAAQTLAHKTSALNLCAGARD